MPLKLALSTLRVILAAFALFVAVPQAWPGAAPACDSISEAARRYTVCVFDIRKAHLRLFLKDAAGKPYGSFAAIAAALKTQGDTLAFAMNAGMFGTDYRPVGLYIENGRQIVPLNTRGGGGNFHLKPNGIFYFGADRAGIIETSRYLAAHLHPEFATQSGPMLVINGVLHPKIKATGTSEKIRNGVGVRDGHIVVFAISDEPVTFYRFATLFRDRLHCPNALFLDGSVSSLYAPAAGRDDTVLRLGPIVGVVDKGVR